MQHEYAVRLTQHLRDHPNARIDIVVDRINGCTSEDEAIARAREVMGICSRLGINELAMKARVVRAEPITDL